MMLSVPAGKTPASLNTNIDQSALRKDDRGYIDGYVFGADERPYAVFVRLSDGAVDLVSVYQVRARSL